MDFKTYSAAGNIIGVAYYPRLFDTQQFIADTAERVRVREFALRRACDSVMVLVRNAAGLLETVVFEPNGGGEAGTFSAMCGNGVRAVAAYAREHLGETDWPLRLKTQSGELLIERISENSYCVRMGAVVTQRDALRRYVNPAHFSAYAELRDLPIPAVLLSHLSGIPFGKSGAVCSIGMSTIATHARDMDGEPHLVLTLDGRRVRTMNALRAIAGEYGSEICTNRELFPLGMNVNFMALNQSAPELFLLVTFERNLGDDPVKAVTQSCGTGATFVGVEHMQKTGDVRVTAQCRGGELIVEQRDGQMYLTGEVHEAKA